MTSDLQIPQAIPFGDITEGELVELASTVGAPAEKVLADTGEPPMPRSNPEGVYDDFYRPLGRMVMHGEIFSDVGRTAAGAANIAAIRAKLQELKGAVEKEGKSPGSPYFNAIRKMDAWLASPRTVKPPSPIFVKGNKKLPFWQFSALPGITCPGAGACLVNPETGGTGYCYSFSGWRNIYPFFRQLQNTILLRLGGGEIIRNAWHKLPKDTVVRLYVDGDIDSGKTLDFWMDRCHERPDLKVYGYSKSWPIFVHRHKQRPNDWPKNYLLNISDASKYWDEKDWLARIKEVPVYRGIFASIGKVKSKMPKLTEAQAKAGVSNKTLPGWKEHMEEVRNRIAELSPGTKHFACPGLCADCLPNGRHACGDPSMRGTFIGIAVH